MRGDHYSSSRPLGGKGLVGAWLIGSAAIAWLLVCLPVTATSSASVSAPRDASVLSRTTTSNKALKGDRLDQPPTRTEAEVRGETRVMARPSSRQAGSQIDAGAVHEPSQPALTSVRKIPVGCEVAFSRLVKAENFATRCVTGLDSSLKLALMR